FHFRYWENLADVCAFGHENVEQIYLAFKFFHCPLFEREIDQHLYKLAQNYPNLKCIKLHRFNDTLSSLKFFAQCPIIHLEYQFSEQPGISENFCNFLLQDCRINMQIYANYDLYVALMKNSYVRSALSQRSWVKFSNSDVVI
uniref:Uncharacterized protein n=1 Tax=Romanomermis culicivorax TaxID=13658 RepID=A0A915L6C5_ROMCU